MKLNFNKRNEYRDYLIRFEKTDLGEIGSTYMKEFDFEKLGLNTREEEILNSMLEGSIDGRGFFKKVDEIFKDFYEETGYRITYKDLLSNTLIIYEGDNIEFSCENGKGLCSKNHPLDLEDEELIKRKKLLEKFNKCVNSLGNYYLYALRTGRVEDVYNNRGVITNKKFVLNIN